MTDAGLPDIENVEYDICDGWFCVSIPEDSARSRGFLLSREDAAALRDALNVYLDDVEDLPPSPCHEWHRAAAAYAGPAPGR